MPRKTPGGFVASRYTGSAAAEEQQNCHKVLENHLVLCVFHLLVSTAIVRGSIGWAAFRRYHIGMCGPHRIDFS